MDYNWFFRDGFVKNNPSETHHNENTILEHCVYLMVNCIYTKPEIKRVLSYYSVMERRVKGQRSHDNTTAFLTYLARAEVSGPEEMRNACRTVIDRLQWFPEHRHPRDWVYYSYLQGDWLIPLMLSWFYVGASVWMALTKYKSRNGRAILKTDTEQLYWMKSILPFKYKWHRRLNKIIMPMLADRFPLGVIDTIAQMRYQEGHPIREARGV